MVGIESGDSPPPPPFPLYRPVHRSLPGSQSVFPLAGFCPVLWNFRTLAVSKRYDGIEWDFENLSGIQRDNVYNVKKSLSVMFNNKPMQRRGTSASISIYNNGYV